MGCDGGTIPKRHELVKGPKKVEKVSDVGPVGTVGTGVPSGGGAELTGLLTLPWSFISLGELILTTLLVSGLY